MKILFKAFCVVVASAFIFSAKAQYRITVLDSTTFQLGEGVVLSKTSFRGLSVVDDHVIWVSGSRGTVARSVNSGKSFEYKQLKGYEKSDFRDIEAFDDKRAIIMSSGTPVYILKTVDGGQSWKEVYKNADTAYFLDAMDFWDEQRGILVGDPINEHFVLMETKDGGDTWQQLDTARTPIALDGEAVFAASGTSLRCWGKSEFGFVSGGSHSRIFIHSNGQFEEERTTIQSGKNSSGAFSMCRQDSFGIALVGGDYMCDTCVTKNSFIISPKTIHSKYKADVKGYRSGVEILNAKMAIACGTSGTDIYYNDIWQNISAESFNVVRKAKKGNAVFLAGSRGKIGKLMY